MKHGKDHGCYGRLPYDKPHDTVHSYHKPHWHPSLVPFGPRVMSVREKARVQGFPDNFVFRGDVGAMYKQIGNAVSPQLTKGIARSILASHSTSLGDDYKTEPTYSQSLEMFFEFANRFDLEKMPILERHAPKDPPRPQLDPMTYEEILIEYNTECRSDHSSRYASKTPFSLLEEVDGYRQWMLDSIHGALRAFSVPALYRRKQYNKVSPLQVFVEPMASWRCVSSTQDGLKASTSGGWTWFQATDKPGSGLNSRKVTLQRCG